MIYLRVIDGEIFEWLITFKKEIYTGYLVITPKKGKTKLTDKEISQSAALALQGALATLDLLHDKKLKKKDKKLVKAFEKTRPN
jgi:hypothetical protein